MTDVVNRQMAVLVEPNPLEPVNLTILCAVVVVGMAVNTAPVKVLFVSVSVVAFPTNVSVATGRVSTLEPATAGALRVILPDVSPLTITLDIYYP